MREVVYWISDGEFSGVISLRCLPNSGELPAGVSGHISYAVVPWKSRKGYARQALADLLQRVPRFGLQRLLVTTHQDNLPSRRVIEATGGILAGLVPHPSQPGKFRLQFWLYAPTRRAVGGGRVAGGRARMDYDAYVIAEVYDKARALLPATARLWQELLADYIDPGAAPLMLDLGCGTGRFSDLLGQRFGGQVIGIDSSERMVQRARRKPNRGNICWCRASAEALPLADGCTDLVFMSMVYHHLGSPAAAARECRRVLRDGGYVCIRNGTRESDFPHRHFFALQPLINTELPARAEIAGTFESAGFTCVTHRVVRQTIAPDWRSFIEKSALRGDSFLARLSDNEFRAGMDALQAHGDSIDVSAPVTEEIDWFVFARHGSRVAVSKTGNSS
jgi:SAM-dependent methyltransferase